MVKSDDTFSAEIQVCLQNRRHVLQSKNNINLYLSILQNKKLNILRMSIKNHIKCQPFVTASPFKGSEINNKNNVKCQPFVKTKPFKGAEIINNSTLLY